MEKTQLAIIGSGPAGLAGSIYASRFGVENLVFGLRQGGTIGYAHSVENYPGFESISGLELMAKIETQTKKLGAEIIYDPVVDLTKKDEGFVLKTQSGVEYGARMVLLATGTSRRKLDIPGEKEFLGRGVSYCTTCDVPFFRDKIIGLVGGSDGAVSGAIHAVKFVKKAYVIYRGKELRAEPIWAEKAQANPKIEIIYQTSLVEIKGEKAVSSVSLDRAWQGQKELSLDGVFIEIGGIPENDLAKKVGIELNEQGYLKVNRQLETSVAGVLAAGDNTNFWPHFQQMVAAEAMGARAALTAYEELSRK